jgi:hypothetical protein
MFVPGVETVKRPPDNQVLIHIGMVIRIRKRVKEGDISYNIALRPIIVYNPDMRSLEFSPPFGDKCSVCPLLQEVIEAVENEHTDTVLVSCGASKIVRSRVTILATSVNVDMTRSPYVTNGDPVKRVGTCPEAPAES